MQCFEKEFGNVPNIEYEIIVVDDGSEDDSLNVINAISKRSHRIFCYSKNNTGVSDSRNFGLSKARGEYVWFFDSDDLLFEGSVKEIIVLLEKTNPDILQFSSVTQDNTNLHRIAEFNNISSYKILFNGKYEDYLMGRAVSFACWGKIVRRRLLIANKLFFNQKLSICEDVWWNIQIAQYLPFASFIHTDLNVVRYIVRKQSAVNSVNAQHNHRMLDSSIYFYSLLDSIGEVPPYMEKTIELWQNTAVDKSITRFLSCEFSMKETSDYIKKIQFLIRGSGAQGKVVSFFTFISKSTLLTRISQLLYRKVFLRYIKPRIGRN